MSETATEDPDATRGTRTTSGWSRAILRWRRFRGSIPWRPILLVAAIALVVGVLIGRSAGSGPIDEAAQAIDSGLLPLALDTDSIWTSASVDRESVSEAFVQLRREDDPTLVLQHEQAWREAYEAMLVQLAGVDMPTAARPVQRQFIASVALSRDAVEVLAHAARVEDPVQRQDLLTEVGRLRERSEQLSQSARASLLDLEGQRADVTPLGPLTSFQEGRR